MTKEDETTQEEKKLKGVFHDVSVRLSKLLIVVLVTAPFAWFWYGFYVDYLAVPYFRRGNWMVIFLFSMLYVIFGRVYEAFRISTSRVSEIIYSQVLAEAMANFLMYLVMWLLMLYLPNPLPLMGALLCEVLLSTLWAVAVHTWYFHRFEPQKSIVVYDVRKGMEHLIGEYELEKKFEIVGSLYVQECLEDLSSLDRAENVFLSGIHSHDRNVILKYCVRKGIGVYVIPRIGDVLLSGAKKIHMFHLPILKVGRYNPPLEYLFMKRLMDILVSLAALVILSPVFLITAIAIKKCDGGPVFYKQRRLTKDGRPFDILKFRSMRVNAEEDAVARLSTGETDERVTKVGRVIRKFRVDELPQLINILLGELSLCGPRPERPEIARQYEKEMPEFNLRLQAKAGLTGYAQVYGKYNTTPYDKLQMDLMYLSNPSFLEDLRIMFATVKILFLPESTEGIANGAITAIEAVAEEAVAGKDSEL